MNIKSRLKNIKYNNFSLPEEEKVELVNEMLDHIGSVDSELRDDLIYGTFSHWMINGDLSDEIVRDIFERICTDKQIFYRIGEKKTDSVFKRSFSVLLIPLILIMNEKRDFLSKEEIVRIKDEIIKYSTEEKDLRGFVIGKGWAHAVAHLADAIDELGKNPRLTKKEKVELLGVIKKTISRKDAPYFNLEDERLATATVSIIQSAQLSISEIKQWLEEFLFWDKTEKWEEEYILVSNTRNFLSSLFFRLTRNDDYIEYAEVPKDVLNRFMEDYI